MSPESFWSLGVAWPSLMLCWIPESIHGRQCLQIFQECDIVWTRTLFSIANAPEVN